MGTTSAGGVDGLLESGIPVADSGPPPRRKANPRKKAVPYGLSAGAVIWLLLFFVLPSFFMLSVSLSTGTLGTLQFAWKWSNYSTMLTTYDTQYIRSVVYALIVTLITLTVAYPVAYWISFYGGKRKNVYLLLLLLPFFVSFVLRTVQFQFIFSDNGPVLGTLKKLHILGPFGAHPVDAVRRDRRDRVQLPPVHRAPAVRGARADRAAPVGGRT